MRRLSWLPLLAMVVLPAIAAEQAAAPPPAVVAGTIRMAANAVVAGGVCSGKDPALDLPRVQSGMRSRMVARGVAAADFDRQFKADYLQALKDAKAMTPAQREHMCASVRAMAAKMQADARASQSGAAPGH